MRLAFPNGEHEDFTISRGTFSIGSSDDDDIALSGEQVQSRHAEITVDHRGITLHSETDESLLAVNDRPVQRRAILRLGDRIELAGINMLLCGEESRLTESVPDAGAPESANRNEPARFLIRGLSGDYLGKAINLYDRLTLGPADADITISNGTGSAVIQIEDGQIYLRDGDGVAINGHALSQAPLQAGDQLVFGSERFLLEAPGFVPGKAYAGVEKSSGAGNTQVFTAPVIDEKSGAKQDDSPADATPGSRRDAIIIGVCLLLSAAMVAWLISVYLSG